MKKVVLIICIISFQQICAQEEANSVNLKSEYLSAAKNLKKYYDTNNNTRIVSSYTYKLLFSNLFSNIITGNSNIVKNFTGVSYSVDDKKNTLSINYAYYNNKKTIFNIGVVTETAGSIFNIYSKNNWNNGVSVAMNGSTFCNNALFYTNEEKEKLNAKRDKELLKILIHYYNIINAKDSLNKLHDTLKAENSFIKETTTVDSVSKINKRNILSSLNYRDSVAKKYDSISLKKINNNFLVEKGKTDDSNTYFKVIQYDLTKFELENTKDIGYSLHWINYGLTAGLSNTKIYNDTLISQSLVSFKKEDYLRANFNFSYSYIRKRRFINFVNLGASLYNTNFLENRLLSDIPNIKYDETEKNYVIATGDKIISNSLDDLKKNFWVLSPSFTYVFFYEPTAIIGFQMSSALKVPLDKPNEINYNNSFDAYLGLILRLSNANDINSKGLISLEGGLYNAEFGTKVWYNAFALRLKIGVPIINFLKS